MDPYLLFNGECESAFHFYAQCLGGSVGYVLKHGDSPMSEGVSADWRDKVMHARLDVRGKSLLGSDAPPPRYEKPRGFSITLAMDDPNEAERVFNALAEGGVVQMPLQPTFWALRFGMVVDRWSIPWMVNCTEPVAEAA